MNSVYQSSNGSFSFGVALWRHKLKVACTFISVVALTLVYLSQAPRTYLSEAKVFVQVGHESVNLDPTASANSFLEISAVRENEVNAVVQLLGSRTLAEKVVDQFGPEAILEMDTDEGTSLGDRLAWLNQYNLNPLRIYSLRDQALETLQQNLGVSAGKKTNVINVSYETENPTLSRDVLESLLQSAREEHLRINRTKGSLEFFEGQSNLLQDDLTKLENELRDLKDSTGLASLATQREIQLQQIGALESDLLRARAERDAVVAEVLRRKQQLADSPAMIVTESTTGQPDTPKFSLRQKLYDLEVKEQELASKLKDDAPQLIAIRAQIVEARKIVEDEAITTQTTRGVNQIYQTAALALQERDAQLVALTARTESLDEKIATARSALKSINENEVKLVRLEREIEIARATYRRYADNLEVARIDQELQDAKISSLNLLQPPSYSQTPASPSPKLTLVLGFAFACLCSVGVALWAESRRLPVAAAAGHLRETSNTPMALPARSRLSEVAPANPR